MVGDDDAPALRVHQREDHEVVLTVEGDLDRASLDVLSTALEEARRSLGEGPQRLLLDMAGVRFIDSSGLRAMLEAREALSSQGDQLVVRDPSKTVRRLLEITDLVGYFRTENPGDSSR